MRKVTWPIMVLLIAWPAVVQGWPNGPDEDPCLSIPSDGGFQGQWNLWSFVPGPHMPAECPAWMHEDWTTTPGFRTEELALGTGIHADRAWQVTQGDRRVIVAVLDSGVYWDNRDLVNKYYLNRGELSACKPTPMNPVPEGADAFDVDGSGWFDIRDYYAAEGDEAAMLSLLDSNGNGMLDPQDLILSCSDGVDDDGNGYVDDLSGWDFFHDDNDAYDDNRFGHGNGEAKDSVSEGDNAMSDIGVCPDCTALMVRVGDSFVVDVNEFAQGVIFAVDSGASVIQEALGGVNNTPFSQQAIDYAYDNGATVVASAADELSFHHNFPGTNNHTVYVHAIQYDGASADQSTTFLNFNNCTNFGMQLLLSTPGTGCSSEATGITAGHVGLIYAAGLQADLDPPLSAEEVKQVLIMNVDDIDVNPLDDDPTKFRSGPGWDWHFGYGRNNARKTVDAVVDGEIPPEVDLVTPLWFEVIYPDATPSVDLVGRISERRDGQPSRHPSVSWTLDYAVGVAPVEDAFQSISSGESTGMSGVIAAWDVTKVPLDLDLKHEDPHQNAVTVRLRAFARDADGEPVLRGDGSPLVGEMRKGFLLARDPDLRPGYPVYLGGSGEASPVFADLNGDGAEELVVVLADGTLHAYDHRGGELAGFPVELGLRWAMDTDNPAHVRGSCAYREDKTGCLHDVGVVDPDVKQTMMMPPAIGDLDGDGTLELVVGTWDGEVFAFEHDGTLREGWPQSVDRSLFVADKYHVIESGFFAAMVLADLDEDGRLDVIGAAMDQHIYVWHDDGSPLPPYPVKVSSDPDQGARIICTPAVGDIDGDGSLEIAVGTSEIFGAGGNANEAVAYVLEGESGAIADGWPQSLFGLTVDVLPIVGRGIVTNPILADLDYDGKLEISFDTISTQGWIFRYDGSIYRKMDNKTFGEGSDSADTPAYILMNNGAMGHIDGEGGVDFVKGTAGFDFALAFAGGGTRGYFDHQLSGWDTDTGKMMAAFPRVMDDWQFFNTPTIVDVNNDNNPEILLGSAGYLVHAWNHLGEEPEGWPKQTGGWIMAAVAVGDHDGDGLFDAAITTRDGWLFMWNTAGKAAESIYEWNGFGHDPMNTGNYETSPVPFKTWGGPDQADTTTEADTLDQADTGPPPPSSGGGGGGGCGAAPVGLPMLLSLLVLWRWRRAYAAISSAAGPMP